MSSKRKAALGAITATLCMFLVLVWSTVGSITQETSPGQIIIKAVAVFLMIAIYGFAAYAIFKGKSVDG